MVGILALQVDEPGRGPATRAHVATETELVRKCLEVLRSRGAFCKRPGNVPSGDQREFLNALNRRGGLALLVYDAVDLAEIIDRELQTSSQGES